MPQIIDDATREALRGVAIGDGALLEDVLGARTVEQEASGLDPTAFAAAKVAALIALDAPPASYLWQINSALASGVPADQFLAVLRVVAPQVGVPRTVAAAAEIMLALGLPLEDEQ